MKIVRKATVAWEDRVVSCNTCLNRAFHVNCRPPPPPPPFMACFETGVVSHSSLGLEKQIRPGWGPGGGMGGRRWWTPEVDAAGLPLPRTPHPDNGSPCSHSDRGRSERNAARINWYACFSSPVIVAAANQLVMLSKKKRSNRGEAVPVPNS